MKIKLIDFGAKELGFYPTRKHYNDAGADVYALEDVYLDPGDVYSFGLGFGIELPDGYMGLIFPRSSMSAAGLTTELPPIDSGYKGEIHGVLTNNSNMPKRITKGDRIGQLVITPIILADFVDDLGTERGTGAFGSTGK